MPLWLKVLVSGLINGALAFLTGITAGSAGLNELSRDAIIWSAIGGAIVALKDIQAFLSLPSPSQSTPTPTPPRAKKKVILPVIFFLALTVRAFAIDNETIHTPPVDASNQATSSYFVDTRTFLTKEDAARCKEQGLGNFVFSGGFHDTAPSTASTPIATVAYTSSCNRVDQAAASINYSLVGCAANDLAWVIASASASDNLANFVRVTGTDYYVDCATPNQPTLPDDSTWLMRVTITNSAIAHVGDLRSLSPGMPFASTVHAGNTTPLQEMQSFTGDIVQSFVYTGCAHATSATTTASIAPCRAYALNTTAPQRLEYIEESLAQNVTYTSGPGTYWLIVHSDLHETPSGWTRVSNTHYLWQQNSVQPALPNRATWLQQVVVANDAISTVNDLRISAPITMAAQSSNSVWFARQHGVRCDGTTIDTPAIQRLIVAAHAAGGGIVQLPAGTCRTDTLHMNDNVTLQGVGPGTILSMIPHTTSHNSVIMIGDQGTPGGGGPPGPGYGVVTNAVVRHLTILGNEADQSPADPGFSHCISIWGSHYNLVEHTELIGCRGDGVSIGYGLGRVEPSNANIVRHNVMYGNIRTALAITNGDDNIISYNKATGVFDLELDPGVTSTIKNTVVHGNEPRRVGGVMTDFVLSLGSQHAEDGSYTGNMITNNVMSQFFGQFNRNTVITGNTFIGTGAVQPDLMRIWGFYDATICNNIFIANAGVATGLERILDVRAGANLIICSNIVDNGTLPFSLFTGTFFAENFGFGHIYQNNILKGTGRYHEDPNGGERASEEAVLRITTSGANPNIVGVFQVSGVPLWPSTFGACGGNLSTGFACGRISFGVQGPNLVLNLPSGGIFWQAQALPLGNFGAQTEPFTYHVTMQVDEGIPALPGTRVVAPFMASITSGAPSYSLVDFANGSGIQAVFFVKITY